MADIIVICKELLIDLIPILQLHFQVHVRVDFGLILLTIKHIYYFILSSQKEESVCGVKHEQDYPLQP